MIVEIHMEMLGTNWFNVLVLTGLIVAAASQLVVWVVDWRRGSGHEFTTDDLRHLAEDLEQNPHLRDSDLVRWAADLIDD